MSTCRVHFIRHGETQNVERIVYGARPNPLTELGRSQAHAAGLYLLNYSTPGTEMVWRTSPVYRAMQTAVIAKRAISPNHEKIFKTNLLTEAISMFDGGRVPEIVKDRKTWHRLKDPHGPSWGESYESTYDRMQTVLDGSASLGVSDVVNVSHQLPIWILRLGLEGRPFGHDPAARQCGHASVTTLTIEDDHITGLNYWENPIKE